MYKNSSVTKQMKRDALWPKPKHVAFNIHSKQPTKATLQSTDSGQLSIKKPKYMMTNHTSQTSKNMSSLNDAIDLQNPPYYIKINAE